MGLKRKPTTTDLRCPILSHFVMVTEGRGAAGATASTSSGLASPPSTGGLGLYSAVVCGLHMPWLLVPISEEGRHEASVPGDPGTRAATSGVEVPVLSHQFQVLLLLFEMCASQSSALETGLRSGMSLSPSGISPWSPSIAEMNGGRAANFIKYE